MKKYFLIYTLLFFGMLANAQSIRKNYQEMTLSERENYVDALYELRNGPDLYNDLRLYHNNFGGILHFRLPATPAQDVFFAWHRRMVFELEQAMQDINPNLSIPYWDSVNDQSTTSPLWDESFMGSFNANWGLNRNLGGNGALPTQTDYNNTFGITNWLTFSNSAERGLIHAGAHRWVGGLMPTHSSPGDPVFYLHHAFIDKFWTDWLKVPGNASTYIKTDMPRYDGTYVFNGQTLPVVNPNSIISQQALGVFYAEDGLAELENYTVTNTYNAQENFYYQYRIEAKNNFSVPNAANCKMESVNEVVLLPGFVAETGSDFIAKIDDDSNILTRPAKKDLASRYKPFDGIDYTHIMIFDNNDMTGFITSKVNPNPFTDKLNVGFNKAIDNVSIEIYDITGKRVASRIFEEKSQNIVFDRLESLGKGVYFLKINHSGKTILNTKVIKN
mgnify:CR=1 FL=1